MEKQTVESVYLCSGKGRSDSRKRDSELLYDPLMLKDLRAALTEPERCAKAEARWLIPSDYREHDARSHAKQRERGLFWLAVVDIDEGNPSLDEVKDACYGVFGGAETLIYSTASSCPEKRKYRVVVPLAVPVPGAAYTAFQKALQAQLTGQGIKPDPAMERAGQLFFGPVWSEHYQHSHQAGDPWTADTLLPDIEAILAAEHDADMERFQQRQELAERVRSGAFTGMNTRDDFCQRVPIDQMLAICGYTRRSDGNYRSPLSTAGGYAVMLSQDGRKAVSLSSTEQAAGFGTMAQDALIYDSFDLLSYFYYQNDPAAALRALAKGECNV